MEGESGGLEVVAGDASDTAWGVHCRGNKFGFQAPQGIHNVYFMSLGIFVKKWACTA